MKIIESSFPSLPLLRPGRKQNQNVEDLEPEKKPKKVNSEIRKQQNRIASRNYREKRKRKLQYLQRLLLDQDGNELEQNSGSPPETSHDGRERSYSADYHTQRPISSPEILPSDGGFSPAPSHGRSMIDWVIVPTSTYGNHLVAASQSFPNIEPAWSTTMYEPQPQVPGHISSWTSPHWMPNLHHAPQVSIGAGNFDFAPQHAQQVHQQLSTPPQQTIQPVPNPELFNLGTFTNHRIHREQQAQRTSNQTNTSTTHTGVLFGSEAPQKLRLMPHTRNNLSVPYKGNQVDNYTSVYSKPNSVPKHEHLKVDGGGQKNLVSYSHDLRGLQLPYFGPQRTLSDLLVHSAVTPIYRSKSSSKAAGSRETAVVWESLCQASVCMGIWNHHASCASPDEVPSVLVRSALERITSTEPTW